VFLCRETNDRCVALAGAPIERAATVAAIKVADAAEEAACLSNRLRVIFPYQRVAEKWQLIPEAEFRERFPLAHAHLHEHRDRLDARDKGRRQAEAWYAWGRSQAREAAGPKLLTKTFAARPNFMLDRSDALFCNGYSIRLREDSRALGLTVELLQRILNSLIMQYFARRTTFQIQGGYCCFQKNFIAPFCLPKLTPAVCDRLLAVENDAFDEELCALYNLPIADLQSPTPTTT